MLEQGRSDEAIGSATLVIMGQYRRVANPNGHRTWTLLLFMPLIPFETSPGYLVYLPNIPQAKPCP